MDHNSAVELLDETFINEFDLDRFSIFIKELFNHFSVSHRDVPLKKEYYDYIDNVKSLGVYRDENKDSIEVFAVKLKRTSYRDRARTMQRNLIANYLKKFNTNAALVAFYGDELEDWRFSFVKMEYDLVQDEKGNLKVVEELTPARRYSFLVGKNEPNFTCRQQFLGLIKEEAIDPALEDIETAFSIENVTQEFFKEYKELYLDLKESLEKSIENDEVILQEFEDKIIKTSDFAKKLMGQIVFIYFLQKKGWLGVEKGEEWGTGPKNFLRKLFDGEVAPYKNFFNDVLEPLFYKALASKSEDDYYVPFNCKIPFLNGGLFEPINDYDWEKTEIILKNDIFAEIFDTFDRYNFTVKEDEPLEKEVAVDPEMLGKVFENLLEIEDRKSKGAYYTPREIVHYMCQESLINYLNINSGIIKHEIESFIRLGDVAIGSIIKEQEQIKKYKKSYEKSVLPNSIKDNQEILDTLLREIKVVDPAVGSGAFPVGMMNEIIRARTILSLYSRESVSNYELKLETIENSLYGVDIDSSAVDIAKLRFWLSLIVDEENVDRIDPLPNLDHKIMCGNSLLDEFEGMKLFDDRFLTSNTEDTTSQSTLDKDFNLRLKKSQLMLKQLKNLIKLFFKEQDSKLKKEYRNEIDKIEWDLIEETLIEDENEEAIHKLIEYKTNKSKPFFLWKLYFSEVFQRENPGFDVVIANPPYGETIKENKQYFKEKFSCTEGKYEIYKYFFEKGINLLSNDGHLTFITPDTWLTLGYFKKLREFIVKDNYLQLITLPFYDLFDAATVDTMISIIKKGLPQETIVYDYYNQRCFKIIPNEEYSKKNGFVINTRKRDNIIKKLDELSVKLGDLGEIWQGLIAYSKKSQPREFTSKKKETKNHRKLLYGSDIGKYRIKWKKKEYLKYGEWLHRPRPSYIFDNEKILVQRIRNPLLKQRIIAAYDNQKYINGTGLSNILINEKFKSKYKIKVILAILNSKLINYWFSYYYHDVNIKPIQLREIPIAYNQELYASIEKLVDFIIDKNKNNENENDIINEEVKELEKRIDDLVFTLYEINNNEIEIVAEFNII